MMNKPTHQVTIIVSSHEDDADVNLQVKWNPLLDDDEIQKLGFVPASYTVAERLLFQIEDMINTETLLEIEEGDMDGNRIIN